MDKYTLKHQFIKATSELADMNRSALSNSTKTFQPLLRIKKQYVIGGEDTE